MSTPFISTNNLDAATLNARLTELDAFDAALAAGTGFSAQSANRLLAGPTSGGSAAPTFRTMVLADIPNGLITATKLANSGVVAGTYISPQLTINAQGQITAVAAGRRCGPGDVFGFDFETGTTTVTIQPGIARSDDDTTDIVRTSAAGNISINAATNGANGLDTGTLGTNQWYRVYVIYNTSTSTCAGLLSLSDSPSLPSGYTKKRRIGFARSNGSSQLYRQTTLGDGANRQVIYFEDTRSGDFRLLNAAAISTSPTWDTVNAAAVVPPTARRARVNVSPSITGAGIIINYRINANMVSQLMTQGAASERYPMIFDMPLTTSQTFELSTETAGTETVSLWVQGYTDNLLHSIV